MNGLVKRLLSGFIIWFTPFLASIFVWDPETGGPFIPAEWFSALMLLTLGIGLAIALFLTITDIDSIKAGWIYGFTWFVMLAALDILVLVLVFGISWMQYAQILAGYLVVPIVTVALAYGQNR